MFVVVFLYKFCRGKLFLVSLNWLFLIVEIELWYGCNYFYIGFLEGVDGVYVVLIGIIIVIVFKWEGINRMVFNNGRNNIFIKVML